MKSTKFFLKKAARILSDDVSCFCEGYWGEFPPSILEKKKLLQDIEGLINDVKASPEH